MGVESDHLNYFYFCYSRAVLVGRYAGLGEDFENNLAEKDCPVSDLGSTVAADLAAVGDPPRRRLPLMFLPGKVLLHLARCVRLVEILLP